MKSGFLPSLKAIVLSPWYAFEVFTGAKGFGKNPIIGSARLNRKGLHIWRVKTTARIVEWRRKRLSHIISDADRRMFEEKGYVEKRGLLPEEVFRQLVKEVEALEAPAREMTEGNAVTRRIALTPETVAKLPAVKAFLDNKEWQNIVRYVGGFNVEPVLSVQTIFANASPVATKQDPQTDLHMDTFHSTAKAWFFLYDVPEDEGPFTYVPGSHKLTKRRLAWQKRKSILASTGGAAGGAFRVRRDELKRLHMPEPTKFAVPANTLVVGDTFGFHARGRSERPSIRVELYASQRPNPFLPFVNLDTAHLPFVKGRKEVISWFFEDLMVRFGLSRPIWREIGRVYPRQRAAAKQG
ncbi:MAG: phytanoyl-CoA dioxygenase family protein [Shinella sp.]|nr:phytanoyl-CoA dioxygenase family protein [Shinella sp.]